MRAILDYYRQNLGECACGERLQFEVEGENPLTFPQLEDRLEKDKSDSKTFLFNPDPLESTDSGNTRQQFSLWQIEKEPEGRLLPGLLLANAGQKYLLIYHNWTTPETVQSFREEIKYKLRHIGCGPMLVTRLSSSATTLKPPVRDEGGTEEVWLKHRNFLFFEEIEQLPFAEDDPKAIINKKTRFLCKGGSLLIVAPSGVGKSTLLMQMAMSWSAGRDFFGLKPVRDLRCFLLQGENDDGDVAEMARGIKNGLKLKGDENSWLKKNFAMQSMFGLGRFDQFHKLLAELVEMHHPDVFFVDPLFAFVQGNFSDQEFMSDNFRQGIDGVLKKSGCLLVSSHHTPKPAKEAPRSGGVDFSYSGFGTSELTNWYRAVATLRPEKGKPKTFRFIVAKRGARADFPDGLNYCLMRHSDKGLFWEPVHPVVIASPDGPLPQEEYDALKLFVQVRGNKAEFRDDIVKRIQDVKKLKYRRAGYYWATIKKYFIKVGEKYRAVPPEELEKIDLSEPGTNGNDDREQSQAAHRKPTRRLKSMKNGRARRNSKVRMQTRRNGSHSEKKRLRR